MDSICLPPTCTPTWLGHIATTKDALLIFQACVDGQLSTCSRRPYNRERKDLIKSGNIFVYEEESSGIQRWTDGIPWSPSRVLTNFLIYRQLSDSLAPGEKRRATKRFPRSTRGTERYVTDTFSIHGPITSQTHRSSHVPRGRLSERLDGLDRDEDRDLVGSLVDSYDFKEHGLFKKTMTVCSGGVHYHMIAYYSVQDAKYNLETPSENMSLRHISISDELKEQSRFKYNDEEEDARSKSLKSRPPPPRHNSSSGGWGQLREDHQNDSRPAKVLKLDRTRGAPSEMSDYSSAYHSSPAHNQDLACMSDSPISDTPTYETSWHPYETGKPVQYVLEDMGQEPMTSQYCEQVSPASSMPLQPFIQPQHFHEASASECNDLTTIYHGIDTDFSTLVYPWTFSPPEYSNVRTHVVGAGPSPEMQPYWTVFDTNRPCRWQ